MATGDGAPTTGISWPGIAGRGCRAENLDPDAAFGRIANNGNILLPKTRFFDDKPDVAGAIFECCRIF
jgi:hypothetical protein